MTEQPAPAGRDLARLALAQYKASSKNQPATGRDARTRTARSRRASKDGVRREPAALGAAIIGMVSDRGWDMSVRGGGILDQWDTLCPQYVDRVQPEAFDAERGRLDLRPCSPAYAAQLRLLGGQLARQINDKLPRPIVKSIRVLPVGNLTATARTAATDAPSAAAPAAPVRTRETASPGYHQALAAITDHEPQRTVPPAVVAAIAASDAALADPARREPPERFTDAVAAHEALTAGQPVDRADAVLQAARERALAEKAGHHTAPVRAFDVA